MLLQPQVDKQCAEPFTGVSVGSLAELRPPASGVGCMCNTYMTYICIANISYTYVIIIITILIIIIIIIKSIIMIIMIIIIMIIIIIKSV